MFKNKKRNISLEEWNYIIKYISNNIDNFNKSGKVYSFLYKNQKNIITFLNKMNIKLKTKNFTFVSDNKKNNNFVFDDKTNKILNLRITKETFYSLQKYIETLLVIKNLYNKFKGTIIKGFIMSIISILIYFFSIYSYTSQLINIKEYVKNIEDIQFFYNNIIYITYVLFIIYSFFTFYSFRKFFLTYENYEAQSGQELLFKNELLLEMTSKIVFYNQKIVVSYIPIKKMLNNIFTGLYNIFTNEDYYKIQSSIYNKTPFNTSNTLLNTTATSYSKQIKLSQQKDISQKTIIYYNLKTDIDTKLSFFRNEMEELISKIGKKFTLGYFIILLLIIINMLYLIIPMINMSI